MAVKIVPVQVNMDKPATIMPYDSEGNMMTPAVTFEANRMAYSDGAKVENGGIYSTLLNINETLLVHTIEDLNTSVDPKFIANNVKMISQLNLNILEDSFYHAIYSHYCVFMGKVNSIIDAAYEGKAPMTAAMMNTNDLIYIRSRYLASAMNQFMNSDLDNRDAILDSHAFVNMCVAFVNIIGEQAYNKAMLAVSEALALTSIECGSDPKDRVIIPFINREFSTMMGDMTYEIYAFVHNIKSYHALVFSNEEIAGVKYRNEPDNNPFTKAIKSGAQTVPFEDCELEF